MQHEWKTSVAPQYRNLKFSWGKQPQDSSQRFYAQMGKTDSSNKTEAYF